MDLPAGIPGRQGAASASLRSPVTKGDYEFIIALHLGKSGGRRRCFTRAGGAARGRGPGVRAGPGGCQPARLPPRTPPGRTRWRFPQSPRFSARRTLVRAPAKSTGLVGEGHGADPDVGSCALSARPLRSPLRDSPRFSAAGAGALRCLPWRAGRLPETERGQHRLINASRCLQQGICTQRDSKPIAYNCLAPHHHPPKPPSRQ